MDVFTADAIDITKKLLQRNITTIEIVDDVAFKNGLFIDAELFKSLWFKRMRQITDVIHKKRKPVFFHSDGDVRHYIEILIDLGIMAVNPIEPDCNDIFEIKTEYGKDIVLMGNFDIGTLLSEASIKKVKQHTS